MSAMPPRLSSQPPKWRWTREQYYQMAELGFFRGKRVELIDGEVVPMSPINFPHTITVDLVRVALEAAFGPNFWVRTQAPFVTHIGEPEPDVAVVSGCVRTHTAHPTTAELVVEVADTSFDYDTHDKASLYASARVPEYWVVDLERRRLIIFRGPKPAAGERFGHRYEMLLILDPEQTVSPLGAPHATITVADLLP